jgi:hypothetical protein
MPTGNRERRARRIHERQEEILALPFEELAARTHPPEGDWPGLSKAYSVIFTWATEATGAANASAAPRPWEALWATEATRAANASAAPRPWEALTAGRTVREILARMDEPHRLELHEAINYAALSWAKGRPRRLRWWSRRPR